MKRIALATAAVAVLAVASAGNRHATLKEKIDAARRNGFRPEGGIVVKHEENGRVIAVRNRQSVYSASEVEEAVLQLCRASRWSFVVADDSFPQEKVGVEVSLVDEIQGEPSCGVLAAPENGWARMAVKRLVSDSPGAERRSRRLRLEMFRAAAMAAGLGIAMNQPCVMAPVSSLKDIDMIRMDRFSPESANVFEGAAERIGISKVSVKGYRQACREGWAPAPTNDVQKAIWDKVHQLPTEPIKIKPETKKVSQ